jgi:hypothetical protein
MIKVFEFKLEPNKRQEWRLLECLETCRNILYKGTGSTFGEETVLKAVPTIREAPGL